MKLLIVDDEPHIRQMMRLTLESTGYQVGAPAGVPQVETLTLNGFRIVRAGGSGRQHEFEVTHFPDGAKSTVQVAIDPEAVARVERLTGRRLEPAGAFWKGQAERLLSTYL